MVPLRGYVVYVLGKIPKRSRGKYLLNRHRRTVEKNAIVAPYRVSLYISEVFTSTLANPGGFGRILLFPIVSTTFPAVRINGESD